MSVIIEAYSCVLRIDAINEKFNGGIDEFVKYIPNQTFGSDGEICRIGFMREDDLFTYASTLREYGLVHKVNENQKQQKYLAFTKQGKGLIYPCDWLELTVHYFEELNAKVYGCALKNSKIHTLAVQRNWSLKAHLELKTVEKDDMKIIGHQDGSDVVDVDGVRHYVGSPYALPHGTKLN